jgi:hypothetical protein
VISPLPPVFAPTDLNQPDVDPVEEPFARRAMRTLALALDSASRGIGDVATKGSLRPLEECVSLGVSANLCDALSTLQKVSGGGSIEFGFTWALARRPPAATSLVRLPAESSAILDSVSAHFRKTSELEDVQVVGFVRKLEKRKPKTSGSVTILGMADGERRSVVVDLEGDTYSEAVRAHEQNQVVECEGEMLREGKSYRLRNPRRFRLLAESEG